MRLTVLLPLLLCSTLFLSGCQPQASVPVGFVSGLTGQAADLGVEGRNGALLAVETLNAAGELRLELLVEDDRQDARQLKTALDALAARGAAWLVGPMTSAMAVAALPELERLRLVAISPTATSHELSGRADHFFRVATDAPLSARQLARALHAQGVRRLAVLMDARNRAYSRSFGMALDTQMQALGAAPATLLDYQSGAGADHAALAPALLQGEPQAVVLVNSAPEAALAGQALRRLAPQLLLAVSPWGANKALLEYGGRALEGTLVLQALDLEDARPAFVDFRQRYQQRFGEPPGTAAVQAYDCVMLGAAAWRARRPGQSLREVLAEPGRAWPMLQGELRLDAQGDTDRPLHLSVLREGRFQPWRQP